MKTTITVEIYSDDVDELSALMLLKQEILKVNVPGVTIVDVAHGSRAGNLIDNLKKSHVTKGTLVKVNAPHGHRLDKFNGEKGRIVQLAVDTNPYPIVQLEESGKQIAIELKHLIYAKQTSIF